MTTGAPVALMSGAGSAAAFMVGAPSWLIAIVVAIAAYVVLFVWAPVWVEGQRERIRTRRIENDRRENRVRREIEQAPVHLGGTGDVGRSTHRQRRR